MSTPPTAVLPGNEIKNSENEFYKHYMIFLDGKQNMYIFKATKKIETKHKPHTFSFSLY